MSKEHALSIFHEHFYNGYRIRKCPDGLMVSKVSEGEDRAVGVANSLTEACSMVDLEVYWENEVRREREKTVE